MFNNFFFPKFVPFFK